MEMTYLIASLCGVIAGVIVCWFEVRWAKTKQDDFHPQIVRYILIPLVLGLTFPLLIFVYGLRIKTFGYAAVSAILCAVALADIDTAKIPNKLIIAGVAVWAVTVWFVVVPENDFYIGSLFAPLFGQGFFSVMVDSLLAAIVIGGLLLVFSVVYEEATERPSLGGGDIKLFTMIALFLGVTVSILNLLLSCVLGLIIGFTWNLAGRKHREPENLPTPYSKTKTFPFGPAIALSSIVMFIVSPLIIPTYIL